MRKSGEDEDSFDGRNKCFFFKSKVTKLNKSLDRRTERDMILSKESGQEKEGNGNRTSRGRWVGL